MLGQKSAIRPGSIFNRQGGSVFNQRQHLLDLDVARYAAGWGRIKYVNDQFAQFEPAKVLSNLVIIPKWDDDATPLRTHYGIGEDKKSIYPVLQERGVFFSFPMDLDFAMLLAYPGAYLVVEEDPDAQTIAAVLGKSHHDSAQYTPEELRFFATYHQRFKLGSKPAAHLEALAKLTDEQLLLGMPESLNDLADAVIAMLKELPE